MKLSIAYIAAALLIKWTCPDPGTYYLYSLQDNHAVMEASHHVSTPCHAAHTIAPQNSHKIFYLYFVPDENPQ